MFKAISNAIKWIGQHFLGMLFLLIAFVVLIPSSTTELRPANLQEIQLIGPIFDADGLVKEIEEAQNDPKIKGVLLSIDSPGGAVAPSIEIAYAIKTLKGHKPVIAYASGIMASGSYYSAIYATKIIANPGSIVGSIGVIMESANIEALMKTIGIETQIVKEGRYKEAGTPTRKWTDEERAELERLTKDTYALFVQDVANARGLNLEDSQQYADAHIFSSKRAKEVGLIDEVNVKSAAKAQVAQLAKVSTPVWSEKDKLESFMEQFVTQGIMKLHNAFGGLKSTFGY
ncbi:MAG: hypothetical protein RL113_1012 [Pseudomonadota bacterium]|jgi:protease-4